jgi:hypothetical protein
MIGIPNILLSSPPAYRRPSMHEPLLQSLRVAGTEVGLLAARFNPGGVASNFHTLSG